MDRTGTRLSAGERCTCWPLQQPGRSVLGLSCDGLLDVLSLIFRAGLEAVKAACVEETASEGHWISVWGLTQLASENQREVTLNI